MRGKRKRLNGFINKSSSGCKAGIRMARRWKMNPAVSVIAIPAISNTARSRVHGALGSDGRFAQFRSAEQGLKALADLLQVYAKKGRDTIRRIIKRYAPSSENKTEAYIA